MAKSPAPFIIAGILIGSFLTIQLRSDVTPVTSFALDEYEFQQELVQSFVDEQGTLQAQLSMLVAQVEVKEAALSQVYTSADTETLQSLKEQLGLTEVRGAGIEIVLEDSATVLRDSVLVESDALIHASDLRDVVNMLRTFPLVGLSINGQRVVSATAIQSVGNTILVNNLRITPPFTFQVITDIPDLVIQKLSNEAELPSLYGRVVQYGLTVKFKKVEELTIPAYVGGYSTHFLTVSDET